MAFFRAYLVTILKILFKILEIITKSPGMKAAEMKVLGVNALRPITGLLLPLVFVFNFTGITNGFQSEAICKPAPPILPTWGLLR